MNSRKKRVDFESEFVKEVGEFILRETSESRAAKHAEQHHNNTFRCFSAKTPN